MRNPGSELRDLRRLKAVFGAGLETIVMLRPDVTPTVRKLTAAVPFKSEANRWGDEVYFSAPFHSELERDARAQMQVGEVAYWPSGDAMAMFFGQTPASTDGRPMAYSPCNIIGAVEGDPVQLNRVASGCAVEVRAI